MKSKLLICLTAALILSGCQKPAEKVPLRGGSCGELVAGGFPKNSFEIKGSYFICHKNNYALNYNPTTRTPMWVVEKLKKENVEKNLSDLHRVEFRIDPLISPARNPKLEDYDAKYGYLMLPLASPFNFPGDHSGFSKSHYLSNVVPQHPGQKRAWESLEKNVRNWAKIHGELFVITGPLFLNGEPKEWIGIGTGPKAKTNKKKVAVPTHMYKVVIVPSEVKAIAFLIPNQTINPSDLPKTVVSIESLEKEANINFFPALDPSQAEQLRKSFDPNLWPMYNF